MSQNEKVQPERAPPVKTPPEQNPREAIVQRVNAGDKDALVQLRTFLASTREAAARLGGDLSFEANARLVAEFTGDHRVRREALFQELHNLRDELCGENKHPVGLERLLIEDVVATWLHLHRLQCFYAGQERPTFHTDSFYQKEITAAHRRYLASIRALIDARRRPLPSIQINVAEQQVNVAGSVAAPAAPDEPKATPAPLG